MNNELPKILKEIEDKLEELYSIEYYVTITSTFFEDNNLAGAKEMIKEMPTNRIVGYKVIENETHMSMLCLPLLEYKLIVKGSIKSVKMYKGKKKE